MLRTNAVGVVWVKWSDIFPCLWLLVTALVRVGVSDVSPTAQGEVWLGPCVSPKYFCIPATSWSSTRCQQHPRRLDGCAVRLWEFPKQHKESCSGWLAAHSISIAQFPTCSGSGTTGSSLGTQQHIKWDPEGNHRRDPSVYADGLADPHAPSPTHRVHLLETDHKYLPFIKHVVTAIHSEYQERHAQARAGARRGEMVILQFLLMARKQSSASWPQPEVGVRLSVCSETHLGLGFCWMKSKKDEYFLEVRIPPSGFLRMWW